MWVLLVLWCALLVAWIRVGRGLGQVAVRPAEGRTVRGAVRLMVGLSLALPLCAAAQTDPLTTTDSLPRVTLQQAQALFAAHNPELRLARARVAEAQGIARQAGTLTNPILGASFDPLFGSGTTTTEVSVLVSQPLEWPGARRARTAAAEARARVAAAEGQADSLRLAFTVTEAYVAAGAAEAQLSVLSEVAAVFRRVEAAGSTRYAEGDLSGFDLRRLRVEHARYETAFEAALVDASAARRTLALLILPDSLLSAIPEIAPAEPVDARAPMIAVEAAMEEALVSRSEVAAARQELAAAHATRDAARLGRRPAPTFSAGYQRQAGGLHGPTVGLALPLPIFDRKRGALEAEAARVVMAQARLALAERGVVADVQRAYSRYASAVRRAESLQAGLLAETDDLLRIAQVSYGEGELSLVELLDAASAYREARLLATTIAAEYQTAHFDLLRATGVATRP